MKQYQATRDATGRSFTKPFAQSHRKIVALTFFTCLIASFVPIVNGASPSVAFNSEQLTVRVSDSATDHAYSSLQSANYFVDKNVLDQTILVDAITRDATEGHYNLISHGRPGHLLINGNWLDAAQVADWLKTEPALRGAEQLNIYGCDFARGDTGSEAVAYLEQTLGLKVAASTNVTGFDGDWVLETAESYVALAPQDYAHNLQVTNLIEDPTNTRGLLEFCSSEEINGGTGEFSCFALTDGTPNVWSSDDPTAQQINRTTPQRFVYSFDGDQTAIIQSMSVITGDGWDGNYRTREILVETTTDANWATANWTVTVPYTILPNTGNASGATVVNLSFAAPVQAKFVRLSVTDGYNNYDYITLGEFRVFGEFGPALTVDKETSTPSRNQGQQATYTILFSNSGSATTASDVRVTDTLPAGFTFASASFVRTGGATGPGGSTGGALANTGTSSVPVFNGFTLPSGSSVTVTLNANISVSQAAGTYHNSVTVSSNGANFDSAVDNGSQNDEDVTVSVIPPSMTVDLTTQQVGVLEPPASAPYRVVFANVSDGPSAFGVQLSNVLPEGFTYRSSQVSTMGGCSRTSTSNPTLGQSTISWGTWDMADDCVVTVDYVVDVSHGAQFGVVSDDAGISGSNFSTLSDSGASITIACAANNVLNVVNASATENLVPSSVLTASACTQLLENSGFIGGSVWLDEDEVGFKDIIETRLTKVLVELQDGTCTSGVDCPTLLTDQFGNYAFTQLPPGNYQVFVVPATLPNGVTNTAGPYGLPIRSVSLTSGQEVTGQDFGYIADPNTGIIGDRVWSDADGDGVQDLGEAGIEGVTLTLFNSAGGVVATTTSGPDGDYLFTGVPFGTGYKVGVTNNAVLTGFSPTVGPQSEGSYISKPVSLSLAVTTVTDVDFGFDSPSTLTITDRVWFDADGDTVQDGGEPGIANVTVNLLNSSGEVVASTTTNSNGDFTFSGVPEGSNYQLQISDRHNVLDKMVETTGTGGNEAISGSLSTAAAGGDSSVLNTVGDDGTPTFGYNQPGSIAGTVWSDADGSELQDNGEPGIGGVTVTLTPPSFVDVGAGVGVAISTVTAPDGSYQFEGLPPGDYAIDILLADRPAGTHTQDPDADDDHNTVVTLPLGESIINQDFGYQNNALNPISGTVFLDRDRDGVEEANGNDGVPGNGDDETGFEGVTLDLLTTYYVDASGHIDFNRDGVSDALDDGVYAGYAVINGRLDFNGDGAVNGLDDGFVNGVDIINGRFDLNGSGTANDGGDEGRVVGRAIASTTTDVDGNYSFNGLADGDYVVRVTDQDGVVAGYDLTSGLDALPVNVAGAPVNDIDFGYIKDPATGSISGEVFIDEDTSNGIADDRETNLSGVEVYLCRSAIFFSPPVCSPTHPLYLETTVTDVRGEYLFSELQAGDYRVDADTVLVSNGGTLPDDLTLTVDPAPVPLSKGENKTDVDIGYEPATDTGVLSGFVWTDVDSDGFYDAGEAPIGGVTINVLDSNGDPLLSTTTKADGSWIITGISGADLQDGYTVTYAEADIPATLESGQPTNMALGDDRYFPVNLLSDSDHYIGDLDFGFPPSISAELGDISGTIYSDVDSSVSYAELIDGEFQSVTLNLVDCGLDGCGNANDQVIATTSTDRNGDYSFTGLPDGVFQVVITDVSSVLQDLNPLEVLPPSIAINEVDGRSKVDVNAGFVSNTLFGSVGNRVWLDVNNNGLMDVGEPGIQGVTVQCWADNDRSETPNNPMIPSGNVVPRPGVDNLLRTVVTDANGEYYCTSLPTGQYIVRIFDALGFSEAEDGTFITGNVGDHYAKPWSYVLTTNSPNLTADFGVTGSNSLAGKVFIEDEDLIEPDLNGTVDPGVELDGTTSPTGGPADPADLSPDTPAAGVTVALFIEQPNGSFSFVTDMVTDANGDYNFTGLPDGNYKVMVQPAGSTIDGYGQTGDPDLVSNALGHGDEDLVCDSPTSGVCDGASEQALSGGVNVTDVNFGYQKNFVTTPVTLTMFSAETARGGVQFTWESMNEVGHFGYQLYALIDDEWQLLTQEPIISEETTDALATKRYEFFYAGAVQEWFTLVDVSTAEVLTLHGPYKLNEVYGSEAQDMPAFDWSQVSRMPNPALSTQAQSQLEQRVEQLRKRDTQPEVFEELNSQQ